LAISAPVGLKAALLEAVRTKSGMVGVAMLGFLLLLAVLVPILAPYNVVQEWSNAANWADNPRLAAPEWSEFLVGKHLPRTIFVGWSDTPGGFDKVRVPINQSGQEYTFIVLKKTFSFEYDAFPSEFTLYLRMTFGNVSPLVTVKWERPDGESITLFDEVPTHNVSQAFRPITYTRSISNPVQGEPSFQVYGHLVDWIVAKGAATSQEMSNLTQTKSIYAIRPEILLFAKLNHSMIQADTAEVLKGEYNLTIDVVGFSAADEADARAIVFGKVFGIAGTDDQRHDLLVGLMWGAPVALAFGVAGALASVLIQTILGAISGWYGGAVDEVVQRASDFYLIIPTLPILILVALLYRPSIVYILIILVILGLVGATTKVVRSIVLQVKEEQFIEAARSYGASRARILFRYILPRVMPYTFALVALTVPAFIFLEASLSFLGLGDPVLPTWGSTLGRAYSQGALFYGDWWWVVFPVGGIVFTTIAFALLGYAFDKVLNPRLREQ
jgi:peptide/nickel transport system permease protein